MLYRGYGAIGYQIAKMGRILGINSVKERAVRGDDLAASGLRIAGLKGLWSGPHKTLSGVAGPSLIT